jgi:hypothetical protein
VSGHSFQLHIINTLAVFDHKPTSGHLSIYKSTSGHLFYSVYAFGTRLQVHYGPVALFSVYAFGTRLQVHCGSLVLFSVYAFGTRQQVHCGSLVLFSVYAFGTRQQAHCGPLVLFCLFPSFVSALCLRCQSAHINKCTVGICANKPTTTYGLIGATG